MSFDRDIPTMGCAGSRRIMLSALALSLLCAHGARAQRAFPVLLNVSVSGELTLQTSSIDFGRITPGQTQVVPPQEDVADGIAGKVMFSSNVDGLSITIPATMTLVSQGSQIKATLSCAAAATPGAGGVAFPCSEGVTFGGSQANGGPVVFVGGMVPGTETAGKPAGVYTGAVVVTAQSTST
jgi:hypothetical protein